MSTSSRLVIGFLALSLALRDRAGRARRRRPDRDSRRPRARRARLAASGRHHQPDRPAGAGLDRDRTTTGAFRFGLLIDGDYTVAASLEGLGLDRAQGPDLGRARLRSVDLIAPLGDRGDDHRHLGGAAGQQVRDQRGGDHRERGVREPQLRRPQRAELARGAARRRPHRDLAPAGRHPGVGQRRPVAGERRPGRRRRHQLRAPRRRLAHLPADHLAHRHHDRDGRASRPSTGAW